MSSTFSSFLWKLLISIKIFLPLLISFCPPFLLSSSSMAQSSPARWIVANKKNEDKNPKEVPTIFEQKLGQFLITAANPIDDRSSSTSILSNSTSLQILDWKAWENMANESVGLGRNGRSKAPGNPILIVAKEEDESGKQQGNIGGILPAEAEEEEEEKEGGNKKEEWKEGLAHFERKLTAGTVPFNLNRFPMKNVDNNNENVTTREKSSIGEKISTEKPLNLETVDFIKFSNKFTTSTTPIPKSLLTLIEGLNGTNTGLGAPDSSPFGQNIPILPQNTVDLRQLPTLMLLLKQIPTVIRTFQENPSVSAASFTEKIGTQNNGPGGQDFFTMPTGNGLIQQFLGVSNAEQVSKIQSRAVSNKYGGLGQIDFEGKQPQMVEDEIEINKGFVDGAVQMSIPNSQIVPIMTTNAGIPVGRIEIRRLPPSRPAIKSPKIVNETTLFKGLRIDKGQKKKISVKEREQRLNIYGVTLAPSSAYEAPLPAVQNLTSTVINWEKLNKKRPRPQFDIEKLTLNELTHLENIHRKLFNAENGETIGKEEKRINFRKDEWKSSMQGKNQENDRPTIGIPTINQIKSQNITKNNLSSSPLTQLPQHSTAKNQNLKELVRKGVEIGQLDQSMLNDLLAIGELPDLEEMTRGMDLSLLHKPGGFAILKQQFVERLIQRAFNGNGSRKS